MDVKAQGLCLTGEEKGGLNGCLLLKPPSALSSRLQCSICCSSHGCCILQAELDRHALPQFRYGISRNSASAHLQCPSGTAPPLYLLQQLAVR